MLDFDKIKCIYFVYIILIGNKLFTNEILINNIDFTFIYSKICEFVLTFILIKIDYFY